MKRVFNHIIKVFFLSFLILSLNSCITDVGSFDSRRPDIDVEESEEQGETEVELSCGFEQKYDAFLGLACVDECPATTFEINSFAQNFSEKMNDYLNNDLPGFDLPPEDEQTVRDTIEANRDFCLGVKRPTGKIAINEGFCACRDGIPDILGDCAAFCAGKDPKPEATLYGEATLEASVIFDDDLPDLHSWCTANIDDGRAAPSCVLRAKSANRELDITITTFSGSNKFEANISTLPFDETFVYRLVEKGSGSNAQTKAKQLRRIQPEDPNNAFIETPLRIQSVNQYDCFAVVPKIDQNDPGTIFSEAILEQHYYFPSNEAPPPLAPDTNTIFCHDIQQHPADDSAIFPRLNLIPGHFAIWDKTDLRFFDTNSNGKRDINDILELKIQEEYDQTFTYDIFFNLPLPLVPDVQDSSGSSQPLSSNTGFYMRPFTNFRTGETFCPTREHYNSNDPTFRVMKEIIGVDTEAIYLALREPESIPSSDGTTTTVTSFIAIREAVLKQIWFYFDNGQHLEHNDVTATRHPIRFYWPPNFDAPFQKNADQKLYTIGTSEEVQSGGTVFDDGSQISSQIPAPDKRFGCIPVID